MFFCVFGGGGSGSAAPAISGATSDDLVETMVRVWARAVRCEARRVRVRERWRGESAAPSNGCKFQIQNCGAGVRATTNECGSARVRAKALDREYVLALLEYGGSLIVFVKSDREPRILETASDFGAKSAPEPRTLEIVSDSGAKSDPESRICETVSDSGAKSDPESRICETVSDS